MEKTKLHTESVEVVEDPESYAVYITRQVNKRKMEEDKNNRILSRAGSGKLWNNKPRKYDLNYDYRKHQMSQSSLKKKVIFCYYYSILRI